MEWKIKMHFNCFTQSVQDMLVLNIKDVFSCRCWNISDVLNVKLCPGQSGPSLPVFHQVGSRAGLLLVCLLCSYGTLNRLLLSAASLHQTPGHPASQTNSSRQVWQSKDASTHDARLHSPNTPHCLPSQDFRNKHSSRRLHG